MTETTTLRELLLPEFEAEIKTTRRMLEALPEGQLDYKAHEKSMSLARLAGHTAELPSLITTILTTPSFDLSGGKRGPFLMETKPQALAEFNVLADEALTALKHISDETLKQDWKLSYKGQSIYSGTRYMAYRVMGLNHLVHHRAQLGIYLRLLNQPVPATYGPSADEPM